MEVICSYEWFLTVCEEGRLNPNAIWVVEPIKLAKKTAVVLKKTMDLRETLDEPQKTHIQAEIDRLDEQRITYMLEALKMARLNNNFGKLEDDFVRENIN